MMNRSVGGIAMPKETGSRKRHLDVLKFFVKMKENFKIWVFGYQDWLRDDRFLGAEKKTCFGGQVHRHVIMPGSGLPHCNRPRASA